MYGLLDLGTVKELDDLYPAAESLEPVLLSPDAIRIFWEHQLVAQPLPTNPTETLAIAVPHYYDCCTRSIIKDILSNQYGIFKSTLLPRSLALVLGYLVQHPNFDGRGDWLCLGGEDDHLDFSFISLSESVITLEYQGRGNWENLKTQARSLALYNRAGWAFNHVLYSDTSLSKDTNLLLVEPGQIDHLIKLKDVSSIVLEGLRHAAINQGTGSGYSLRIIYPYNFYLQKYDLQKKSLIVERIPFDTANLELDLDGSYPIARFSSTNLYPQFDGKPIELNVYEWERVSPPPDTFNHAPAMTFRGFKEELPTRLALWLHMADANLSLTSDSAANSRTTVQTKKFLSSWADSQQELFKLLANSSNYELQADLIQQLSSPYDPYQASLEDCLEVTRLKLYGLLQLWKGN